jgi:hypothetical protein
LLNFENVKEKTKLLSQKCNSNSNFDSFLGFWDNLLN